MIVQPSSLDQADTSALPSVPPLPAPAASWLIGSHAAASPLGLHYAGAESLALSLRAIALARRSLGIEPTSGLADLPSLRRQRVTPSQTNGARPVGAASTVLAVIPPVALPAVIADPRQDDERLSAEPLAAHLDRRLRQARVLYLPNRGRAYVALKRVLDLVGALVLLLVAWPVIVVLAVLIRHDSPGPAIFAQQGVTRGGRLFTICKFRTMWVDDGDRFPELYDYRAAAGPSEVYDKLTDDPLNTNVGRWLRTTTLDELPKAGVTGLAQVAGPSLLTVRERISLDLRYVANQTLLLDIQILLTTVAAVVLRRGAF